MSVSLTSKRMKFDFPLISLADLDYHLFLGSAQPEAVVLAVLANFKGDSSDKALAQIVQRIEATATGDFQLKKYFKQLRVLAQLRKLEKNLKDITMDSISKFVSVEKDAAYLVGLDKGAETGERRGVEKATERFVTNLLRKASLTIEQVADIAGVSVEFVENIQQSNRKIN